MNDGFRGFLRFIAIYISLTGVFALLFLPSFLASIYLNESQLSLAVMLNVVGVIIGFLAFIIWCDT